MDSIFDFLEHYKNSGISRFHMPGHKGFGSFSNNNLNADFLKYDITEIKGADVLYSSDGIIKNSEEKASRLYGTHSTLFSTGGSTLAIQTMISLIAKPNKKILADRNCHVAFANACALIGAEPVWVYPEYDGNIGLPKPITPQQIQKILANNSDINAVYITSPDYYGQIADIKKIAEICEKYNIPLAVDNAHGSHLILGDKNIHPIALGASICCDSMHKTLPALTGAGLLHISDKFPDLAQNSKSKMSLFGSTSPSYLIMMSIDLCLNYISEQGKEDFKRLANVKKEITDLCENKKIKTLVNNDITKLTFDAYSIGYTGYEFGEYLRQNNIEPEYVNNRFTVLIISPFNTKADFERLISALNNIDIKTALPDDKAEILKPEKIMGIREAVFSNQVTISVDDSLNKIAAQSIIACPPGIPVICPGEKIDREVITALKNTGNTRINVIL